MEILVKLLILLVSGITLPPQSKGQIIPVPENVSGCVIYQGNSISLNVQWNVSMGVRFDSSSTFYTIYYFSNDSDVIINNSVKTERGNLENRFSDILFPTNFTGQQIQVQVGFNFNTQELSRSIPVILDIRPVYLALFAINRAGNITTLNMGLNLACDIESGAACIVEIIPQNNTHSNMSQRQIHNITDEDEENLFRPQQVFLNFSNITEGLKYMVQAHLLSSEGDMIGQGFQAIISVPFETTLEPTLATTTIATAITTRITPTTTTTVITTQPSEPGRTVQSSVIQQTSTNLPSMMETSTMTSAEGSTTISNTPMMANNLEPEPDDSSNIGIAIGVSIGCLLLLVLAITLCIIIILMKRNDKKKKNSSKGSGDYSIPEESFVCANRFSCSSTTVLHNASAVENHSANQGRTSQKHDYSLPPEANYVLYEEAPQVGNSESNNPIPSHYETAENQDTQILPFLSNGHYEMSDAIIQNPAAFENVNQTDYSELVHNSQQNSNDIPPVPSGAYDYDQLGQSAKNENKNTDKPHYYDTLTNLEYIPYQNISENSGYTELQDSTTDQNKPYQSLTNSRSPKFHQYEEVKDDKVTVAAEGNYSEPYNLKNKKLLPHHQYDVVTGDVSRLPKRPFVREYSEPRDTLNIFH